jgi:hypothetical protein
LLKNVLGHLRAAWQKLPPSVRSSVYRFLRPTGLPYILGFLTRYSEDHRSANFSGNWPALSEEYRRSDLRDRESLSRRFAAIANSLVLPNGVVKTTYVGRHDAILQSWLDDRRFAIEKDHIRVLEVPSSIGVASLAARAILSERYRFGAYVLGDLCWEILYDRERRCVFDESGNLLQIGYRNHFFSIYRPHASGDAYGVLASCLLYPLNIVSWYMRRKYRSEDSTALERVLLVHPDLEDPIGKGNFSLERMDVFSPLEGDFDLILSFNLLQKNYFPADRIRLGVENLMGVLSERGMLVMGSTESFSISTKIHGERVVLQQSGDF